jgi:hypothetical protein
MIQFRIVLDSIIVAGSIGIDRESAVQNRYSDRVG